jgi:hypothetical protein
MVDVSLYRFRWVSDGIADSVFLVSKLKTGTMEYSVKPQAGTDDKHSVVEVTFFTEFCEKFDGEASVSRWIVSDVEEYVGVGIDGVHKSELLCSPSERRSRS